MMTCQVKSKQMALAFELPYVLTVSKPIQSGKGSSSYAAAAEKGVPSILAEAGGFGQMQEDAVALLVQGVINVMRHLGMIDADGARQNRKCAAAKPAGTTNLTNFEWLYANHEGM